jgi:hypothetical protein
LLRGKIAPCASCATLAKLRDTRGPLLFRHVLKLGAASRPRFIRHLRAGAALPLVTALAAPGPLPSALALAAGRSASRLCLRPGTQILCGELHPSDRSDLAFLHRGLDLL